MKKRSLFSAVAMLLVSAIVLTSATYAWFASSSQATVGTIGAKVAKSDGSIMVSAYEDSGYAGSLSQETLQGVTKTVSGNQVAQNFFPEYLTPVSFTPSAEAFKKVTMSGQNFDVVGLTANKTAYTQGEYVDFTFYVKSTVACNANITFTLANNQDFVYGYAAFTPTAEGSAKQTVILGSNPVDSTPRSYYPVAQSSATGTGAYDGNANFIVDTSDKDTVKDLTGSSPTEGFDTLGRAAVTDPDSGDTITAAVSPLSLGTKVTSQGLSVTKSGVALEADEPLTVHVYLWAEGQDLNCNGKQTATPSFDVTIVKQDTSSTSTTSAG